MSLRLKSKRKRTRKETTDGLEPNDDRSLRKLRELADGACAIAHNPRKRGDGVLAENSTGGAKKHCYCDAWRCGLEPNDTVRYAHNDGASTIAHNPRERGDGVSAESSTGRSQEKGTCEMQVPFSWAHSTKMQLIIKYILYNLQFDKRSIAPYGHPYQEFHR